MCSARDIGGGERHVADLSNALAKRGHDVFAVVKPNAQIIGALDEVPRDGIFEISMRGGADAMAAVRIAKIVRENRVDIIHAHVARDYPLAALASRRADNTPFVLTRHVLFPLNKLHRLLLRRAARVIAVSNAVAESLRRRNIFAANKIVLVHNGIDLERFRTAKQGALPDALNGINAKRLVGTVGHISPIKGQTDFVRAAALVTREHDDVAFVIVGEDKSRDGVNRKHLEALISELGLNKRVHLIGWQDDIAALLPHLDIFVSAARSEPFGLVILEAMAAGLPVIATASEGAREIIRPEVTGVLVPRGEHTDLAAAINDLLSDSRRRKVLAANALGAVTDFSLDSMVSATEIVYKEAMAR